MHHLDEPVNLDRQRGVSDVGVGTGGLALDRPIPVDDGFSGGVDDDKEGIAGVGSVERGPESFCSRSIGVALIPGVFADIEARDDEAPVHDGTGYGVAKKSFEHFARAAPGRTENEQDVFVCHAGRGFCLLKDSVGVG